MNMTPVNIREISIRSRVMEVLRQVIDPELGINIVDMGLIYSVQIDEDAREIHVSLTLSTKGCPMGAAISGGVENTLKLHFADYSQTISFVWEPAWSPQFISENGQKQLER